MKKATKKRKLSDVDNSFQNSNEVDSTFRNNSRYSFPLKTPKTANNVLSDSRNYDSNNNNNNSSRSRSYHNNNTLPNSRRYRNNDNISSSSQRYRSNNNTSSSSRSYYSNGNISSSSRSYQNSNNNTLSSSRNYYSNDNNTSSSSRSYQNNNNNNSISSISRNYQSSNTSSSSRRNQNNNNNNSSSSIIIENNNNNVSSDSIVIENNNNNGNTAKKKLINNLLKKPNHMELTRNNSQSTYLRSSRQYQSTPLYSNARSQFVIGSKAILSKSEGIQQMKHGFALPLSLRLLFEENKINHQNKSDYQQQTFGNAGNDYFTDRMLVIIKQDLDKLKEMQKISDADYKVILKDAIEFVELNKLKVEVEKQQKRKKSVSSKAKVNCSNGSKVTFTRKQETRRKELAKNIKMKFSEIDFFAPSDQLSDITDDEEFKLYDPTKNSSWTRHEHLVSYEKQITLQRDVCEKVCAHFNSNKKADYLDVHYENYYTCLSVSVQSIGSVDIRKLTQKKYDADKSVANWVEICMYILLAISEKNLYGFSARSSFGHKEPTLAECYQRFRISPGIYPNDEERAQVIVNICEVLEVLNQSLEETFSKVTTPQQIKNLGKWATTLVRKIEKIQKNIWLFIDIYNSENIRKSDNKIYQALQEFHTKYEKQKKLTVAESSNGITTNSCYKEKAQEKRRVVVNELSERLNRYDRDLFSKRSGSCSPVRRKFYDETPSVFARKIILPSAMRATVCAISSVFYTYSNFLFKVENSRMYYEVGDITVKSIYEQYKKLGSKEVYGRPGKDYVLGLDDVNHLPNTSSFLLINNNSSSSSSSNSKSKVNAEIAYLIFDATSSTAEEMANVIKNNLIDKDDNQFIILVISGTKHSFNGLDIGQYGEMRIFSKNETVANNVFKFVQTYHGTDMSIFDHELRRYFKEKCKLPTNNEILGYLSE